MAGDGENEMKNTVNLPPFGWVWFCVQTIGSILIIHTLWGGDELPNYVYKKDTSPLYKGTIDRKQLILSNVEQSCIALWEAAGMYQQDFMFPS